MCRQQHREGTAWGKEVTAVIKGGSSTRWGTAAFGGCVKSTRGGGASACGVFSSGGVEQQQWMRKSSTGRGQ